MIQGDCLARLFSFSFTPTLDGNKMATFALIGEIFQQNELEKLTVYTPEDPLSPQTVVNPSIYIWP